MLDTQKLYKGTSQVAWGYVFLLLNINLGSVSIMPNFVGWFLLYTAIGQLSDQRRELALLRPLCLLLGLYTGVEWTFNLVGLHLEGAFFSLDLAIGILSLYLHFQFLTDLAALAASFPIDEDISRHLLHWRNVQVYLYTGTLLLTSLIRSFGWAEDSTPLVAMSWLLVFITLLLICGLLSNLFKLRKAILTMEPPLSPLDGATAP